MNELFQPGSHPDADQLSAFVEHALPPHEREQTLAHLALCPHCRTIVSLSLPPIDEASKPQPVPPRNPWFYGWNLAWPAATALAALGLFSIFLHNATTHKSIATAPAQMADANPPAPHPIPVAPPSQAILVPKPPPLSPRLQPHAARPTIVHGAAGISNPQINDAVIDAQNIADIPIQGRNPIDLAQRQSTLPAGSANARPQRSAVGGGAGGTMAMSAAPAQALRKTSPDREQLNATATGAGRAAPSVPVASASALTFNKLPQAAAAAPPPPIENVTVDAISQPSEAGTVTATTQAVEVTAAAQAIQVTDAASLASTSSGAAQRPYELPSHLSITSTIAGGNQTLALDTAGALFLSNDGGRQWRAVPTQWPGRAVKLERTSFPVPTSQPVARGTDSTYSAFNAGAAASGPPTPTSTVTGTITDPTGASIPDASITVTNTRTRLTRTVKTDRTGRYFVDGLVPGAYQIEVQAPGFNRQQLAVTLAASQQTLVNLAVAVGQATEAVSVQGEAITSSRATEKRKITALPSGSQSLLVFEITTDTGDRWTSTDGQIWRHY